MSLLLRLETSWAGLCDPCPQAEQPPPPALKKHMRAKGAMRLMEVGDSLGSPWQDPCPVQTPRGVLGTPCLHPHLRKLWLLESTILKLGRKPWRHSPGERTQLRRQGARFPLWAREAQEGAFSPAPVSFVSKMHSPERLRMGSDRGLYFLGEMLLTLELVETELVS